MKVLLIRHGMTPGNKERRYLGRTDESLSLEGIDEIQKRVKEKYYPKADFLLLSPMKRCRQTAELIYPELIARKMYVVEDDLREMDFGEFEYKNYQELTNEPAYQHYIDCGGMTAFPQGEEPEDFCDRCVAGFYRGLEKIEKQVSKEAVVAVVVHGGTIRALMYRICSISKTYHEWMLANGEFYSCNVSKQEGICLQDIS